MRDELRAMLRRLHLTALFVTHDQEDAFAIADRVALMRRGRLLQMGTPEDLYDRPASRDVAEFIGRATLVPAVDAGSHAIIRLDGIERRVTAVAARGPGNKPLADAVAVLRPEALAFVPEGTPDAWRAMVVERRFAGASAVYKVLIGNQLAEVASTDRTVREGDRLAVTLAREPVALVDA
jgi:ABC-type Fe3+/spermidine/putrescine transport system ATPase subunit